MIINIPLTIPDELLENSIIKDYEEKVTTRLIAEVRKTMANHSPCSSWKREERGLENWVGEKIDNVINEYKAEIIEAASDKLAARLANTKAAKEIINDL